MATTQPVTAPKAAGLEQAAPKRAVKRPRPPPGRITPSATSDVGHHQAALTAEALVVAERVNKGLAVLDDPATQMSIAGVSAGVWEDGEVYVRLVLPAGISGGAVLSPAEAAKVAGLLLGAAWRGQANKDAAT